MKKPKETGVTKKYHSCMCLLREDLTLDQIGDIWGLTRERVRQLEEGALQHLARVVSNKRADLESRDVEWKLERLIKVLVESQKMRKERKRIWEV